VLTQTAAETPAAILDPDGFTVVVDGLTPRPIELNGTVTFNDVAAGNHIVTLDGLQVNCTTPENPVNVTVVAGATAQVPFPVTCWAPTTGRVAFSADVRGVYEMYTVNSDGADLRRLTTVPEQGWPAPPMHIWPAWSPDGWKIAYTVVEGWEEQDIYVMNADGTGQTQLTTSSLRDNYPAWSPDGSKIAFSSDRHDPGELDIYVMNADGTGQVRLTDSGHNAGPAWFPDGSKILFTSNRDGRAEVYVMNADGTEQVRLTNHPEGESWIAGRALSPDGSQMLFGSIRDGSGDVYVMDVDGNNVRRLTDWETHEDPAAWSPDGTRILFTTTKTGLIYSMSADGTDIRSVSHGVGGNGHLWPDCSHGSGAVSVPERASPIPSR
jgi:TolB protein